MVLCFEPMLWASSCERELTATLHSEQYRSFLAFSSSDSTLGSDEAVGNAAGLEVFFRATASPVGSVGGLACMGAVLQGLDTNATAGATGSGTKACGEAGTLCSANGSILFSVWSEQLAVTAVQKEVVVVEVLVIVLAPLSWAAALFCLFFGDSFALSFLACLLPL